MENLLPKIICGITECWINWIVCHNSKYPQTPKMKKNREQATSLHFGGIIERELYYSLIKTNVNGG